MSAVGEEESRASPTPPSWPINKDAYELMEVLGSGATAVVQSALCVSRKEKVAIKRIDLEQHSSSIEELQKEISLMSQCHHPNVTRYYTSFVVKDELWLVMKLMSGSLLDIIKSARKRSTKGGVLEETFIATVLKEVLQGLEYFHTSGQIHRDVKAGNILVGEDGSVQVADFGVSSWVYGALGGGKKKNPRYTFVGTPCWMAPEVMDQSVGYDTKADIWSFGITALELATGFAPYAKFPPMKVLMLTLENPPPTLETCGEISGEDYRKNYSKSFQKMVEKCLQKIPEHRPTAGELLKHPFFKKAKDHEFVKQVVLDHALAARVRKVRRVPGASGRLRKTEDGGWVWSDDELHDKEEEESGEVLSAPGPFSSPAHQQNPAKPDQVAKSEQVAKPAAGPSWVNAEPSPMLDKRQQDLRELKLKIAAINDRENKLLSKEGLSSSMSSEEHKQLVMKLLEERQQLERQLQMLKLLEQHGETKPDTRDQHLQATSGTNSSTLADRPRAAQKPTTLRLALRKRTDQNQLKDIKFEFIVGKDTPDRIAQDLTDAGLVDGRNKVVVAANIRKVVENPSQKVTFQLGSIPLELQDEKKLIGYGQLFTVQ